jgi:hypothetical protein
VRFDRDDIFRVVLLAAADLNATQSDAERFDPAENTLLAGDGGQLTSLAVVTFILGVEERLGEALARPVSLFDESLIAAPDGPFRTVGSFVDHIHAVIAATAT